MEPIVPERAEDIWKAVEASLPELRPWMAWAPTADLASTRSFADGEARAWGSSSWTFTILVDEDVAGGVGLDRHDPLLATAQIGYWIRSDLSGRGLMTEAAALVVDFAFRELKLHRLELHAAPANVGSIRVAEKLGFSRGGVLRDGSRGEAGFHDVLVFDLLESDDRPKPPVLG